MFMELALKKPRIAAGLFLNVDDCEINPLECRFLLRGIACGRFLRQG